MTHTTTSKKQLTAEIAKLHGKPIPGFESQPANLKEAEFARMETKPGWRFMGIWSRAGLYDLEKRGLIRLVRLRARGKTRGITLIPVQEVKNYLQRELEASESGEGGEQ